MADGSSVLKLLFLLTFSFHLPSAGTHTLQYRYTPLIPGTQFTVVGLLDGEPFMYYDSISEAVKPKTEWMKKLRENREDYWSEEIRYMEEQNDYFQNNLKTFMKISPGFPLLERMYGCEYDDVNSRGYDEYKYNGEDFRSLNLTTAKWTAVNQPEWIIRDWKPEGDEAKRWKDFLSTTCIDRLKAYVSYGEENLPSKVGPSVSPGVVCFAPGSPPKDVITGQEDGEILKVLSEELQKHKYTCGILRRSLSEDQIPTDGESDERPDAGSDGVGTGVIVAVILCGIIFALSAAGIVIWKKKRKAAAWLKDLGFKKVLKDEEERRGEETRTVHITLIVPDEQAEGDSDEEKLPEMAVERNLERNRTQQETHPHFGETESRN